jgi:glycosyltransferase involved in cell wall biosynthesis
MSSSPVAVIIQRYGAGIDGGAEQYCREVVRRLRARMPVEILTTCAKDYRTWANELPAGAAEEDGVLVRRFPTLHPREPGRFDELTARLLARPEPTPQEEHRWIREQGPLCPGLLRHLHRHRPSYRARIYFTYLYYPTVYGLLADRGRGIFVPTAHDEPVSRLPLYRRVFAAAGGLLFLTEPERAFVQRRFGIGDRPAALAGVGVQPPATLDPRGFAKRHGLRAPYLLYAGRIEPGKGCRELCDHFLALKQSRPGPLQLIFSGRLHMTLPDHPDIRYLGFLPRHELWNALHGAAAVCACSPFESLSLLALEAMAVGAPVVANAHSPVLLHHCLESRAGLPYADTREFVAVVSAILDDPQLSRRLSRNGPPYIARSYRWDRTIDAFCRIIQRLADTPDP